MSSPPPQYIDVCLSSTSTFFVSSTLTYFILFCLPCPVPHPYLACVSQPTQEHGVSQPSCCLPDQGLPAPTPQWKQVKELSRNQNGCCIPRPSHPVPPSEPAKVEVCSLESQLKHRTSMCPFE